jgi:hypothetical protein
MLDFFHFRWRNGEVDLVMGLVHRSWSIPAVQQRQTRIAQTRCSRVITGSCVRYLQLWPQCPHPCPATWVSSFESAASTKTLTANWPRALSKQQTPDFLAQGLADTLAAPKNKPVQQSQLNSAQYLGTIPRADNRHDIAKETGESLLSPTTEIGRQHYRGHRSRPF